MLDRREILTAGIGGGAAIGVAGPAVGQAGAVDPARVVLARDFGVLPDRKGDQTRRLQRAINRAAKSRAPLLLDPGRFAATRLVVDQPVRIVGEPGQTVLRGTGTGPLLVVSQTHDVTLFGLTLDGEAQSVSGRNSGLVTIEDTRNLRIEHCAIRNSNLHGLALQGCSGLVTRCGIEKIAQTGLFSNDAGGLRLTDNDIHDCGNNALQVWRSKAGDDGTLVSGNRIARIRTDLGGSGQNGNGINIYRAGNVIIAHNRITDCAFTAIRSNAGDGCQIIANSCSRSGEVAIYAEFGFEGAIIANNLVEQAAVGISITNFDDGGRLAVCSGNIVRDMTLDLQGRTSAGTGIHAEADTVVSGNVIENAPLAGIVLGWGKYQRDISATGNVVRDVGAGISVSVAEGAGKALIAGNIISGAKTGAILGMDHATIATGDLSAPGAQPPAHVSLSQNATG